jgi:colanic acid/amylovoran biosynthesis glycosyltransferase
MLRVALITSRFPFGPKEPFLLEEVRELATRFDVRVVPTRLARGTLQSHDIAAAVGPRLGVASAATLAAAAGEIVRRPVTALRTLATVVGAPRSLTAKLKNAATFPKALAVARYARRERIDHVHAYWLAAPATVAYVVARMNGIPWSATGHRWDLVDYNLSSTGRRNAGFIGDARFVRTISAQGAQLVRSALNGAGERVRVVHLGVRLPQPPARRDPVSRALRLVCVAGLDPVKGHADLLHAIALARDAGVDVACTLAGDGPLRIRLESLVSELDLGTRVRFCGGVEHSRLLERLRGGEFDAAILTSVDDGSHLREGIPVALMEAMAAGLPCIATASGGVPELVDATDGILVPPRDVEAIGRAIATLAGDAGLRRTLAAGARARIAAAFDVAQTATTLARLIAESA